MHPGLGALEHGEDLAAVALAPCLDLVATAERQFLLLDARHEHGLELEAFRAMQREQVHSLAGRAPVAGFEPRPERGGVAVEAVREPDEAREILLPRLLA